LYRQISAVCKCEAIFEADELLEELQPFVAVNTAYYKKSRFGVYA